MEISTGMNDAILNAVAMYTNNLTKLAFTYTKSMADAEDIVQEVFLTYLKKQPIFHDGTHEKAWLIRVTVNKCKDYLKSRWYKNIVPLTEEIPYASYEENALIQAVLSLDKKYRLPIHLYYYEGYSIEEISKILNAKSSTVGSWLARGRSILRKQIGGFEDA